MQWVILISAVYHSINKSHGLWVVLLKLASVGKVTSKVLLETLFLSQLQSYSSQEGVAFLNFTD